MKIIYDVLDPFVLLHGLNLWAVTPTSYYGILVNSVASGDYQLVSESAFLPVAKHALFLGDLLTPFNYQDLLKKQMLDQLAAHLSEDDRQMLFRLDCEARSAVNRVIYRNNLPFAIPSVGDTRNQLKSVQPYVSVIPSTSFYGKIESIIKLFSDIGDHRILIFTNLSRYLTTEQLNHLSVYAHHLECYLLSFDLSESIAVQPSPTLALRVIDSDFVVFD